MWYKSGHMVITSALQIIYTGNSSRSWLVLRRNASSNHVPSAQFVAELKFRVIEVDPITGEIEGDKDGFAEEYPLEDVELFTADFISEVGKQKQKKWASFF